MGRDGQRGRVRAGGALLLALAASTSACGSSDDGPDAVDAARLAAVRSDPLFRQAQVAASSTDVMSTDFDFRRAQLTSRQDGAGAGTSPGSAARDMVETMVSAGWRLTGVTCRSDGGPDLSKLSAQLSRTYTANPGGQFVTVVRLDAGSGPGQPYRGLVATVPYHREDAMSAFALPAQQLHPAGTCLDAALPAGRDVTNGQLVDVKRFGSAG